MIAPQQQYFVVGRIGSEFCVYISSKYIVTYVFIMGIQKQILPCAGCPVMNVNILLLFIRTLTLCGMLKYYGWWYYSLQQWPQISQHPSLYNVYKDQAFITTTPLTRLPHPPIPELYAFLLPPEYGLRVSLLPLLCHNNVKNRTYLTAHSIYSSAGTPSSTWTNAPQQQYFVVGRIGSEFCVYISSKYIVTYVFIMGIQKQILPCAGCPVMNVNILLLFIRTLTLCGMLKYYGWWYYSLQQWPQISQHPSLYNVYKDQAFITTTPLTRLPHPPIPELYALLLPPEYGLRVSLSPLLCNKNVKNRTYLTAHSI